MAVGPATDMVRFEHVRLRNGLGFASADAVAPPPQEAVLGLAVRPSEGAWPFHVVDANRPVAVVSSDRTPSSRLDAEQAIAARLQAAGFPIVVLLGPEAEGAAVADCYSATPRPLDDAACAVCAVKTIGGWEESPRMTFRISHVGGVERDPRATTLQVCEAAWLTTRSSLVQGAWRIDVTRSTGGWSALLSEVERSAPSTMAAILADVDWAKPYNDAYGHRQGDLMLARVHGRIEAIAEAEDASILRVGGDELALLVKPPGRAPRIAEAIRREVERLAIPFEHPEVRTSGCVTVSVGVVLRPAGPDVRAALEDAVYAAKRSGRNRVATSPPSA